MAPSTAEKCNNSVDNNEEENLLKALEQNERQVSENQRGWEQTRTRKVGVSEERFQLAEKVPCWWLSRHT